MLKKIKFKNSTILFIGLLLILMGVSIGFVEYFNQRKSDIYSDMNILLYESETPDNIKTDTVIENNLQDSNVQNQEDNNTTNEPIKETKYDYIGMLEIPKINLKRGFVDLNSKYNKVNYNITVIKGSTFPNEQNNNLILAAHSGICDVCFFDKLFNLSKGDKAYVNYKNKKYSYTLVNTYEVQKDGSIPIYRDYDKNVLTLITCTRYSDTKQTVFIFEIE